MLLNLLSVTCIIVSHTPSCMFTVSGLTIMAFVKVVLSNFIDHSSRATDGSSQAKALIDKTVSPYQLIKGRANVIIY